MNNYNWVRWKNRYEDDPYKDTTWRTDFRIRVFRILLWSGVFFLSVIVIRALWMGIIPVADAGNLIIFIILLVCLKLRPDRLWILSFLSLCALLVNMVDGLPFVHNNHVIAPAYILYPLLVLYTALLGDLVLVIIACLFVVAAIVLSAVYNPHISQEEFLILSNLFIVIAASGSSAFAIIFLHHKIEKIINRKAYELEKELDTNTMLNALIFHDINNPLAVISGTIDMILGERDKKVNFEDIERLKDMTVRIANIIESARYTGSERNSILEEIPVTRLFEEQKTLFLEKLNKKEQVFLLNAPEDMVVISNSQVLKNSVFSNFVSNAIKFSPRGATITMQVKKEENSIRISVINTGSGFPEELLEKGATGLHYGSRKGTEGEVGTAFGLLISLICLRRLGAHLEIRNLRGGGAEVSALFPLNLHKSKLQ